MLVPIGESARLEQEASGSFLNPWREYAVSNRDVFLEEILNFMRGAGCTREELAAIRKEVQARARALRKSGKRGRPRGSKRPRPGITREPGEQRPDRADIEGVLGWEEHLGFRSICMVCGDYPHLRPDFLGQILCFVRTASKHEVAAIRKAVQGRARSRDLMKKRGRPSALDDDRLTYKARPVAWLRHVEHKKWRQIAEAVGMRVIRPDNEQCGNIRAVTRTLQRQEDYLAARIWEAVPFYWRVREGPHGGELRPEALEHKPLQQWIWIKAGLPFREYPEQCKRIVNALWPRGLRAATEQTQRYIRYQTCKGTTKAHQINS
jgi:hypothetical protein